VRELAVDGHGVAFWGGRPSYSGDIACVDQLSTTTTRILIDAAIDHIVNFITPIHGPRNLIRHCSCQICIKP
jgi:hypothetical protein